MAIGILWLAGECSAALLGQKWFRVFSFCSPLFKRELHFCVLRRQDQDHHWMSSRPTHFYWEDGGKATSSYIHTCKPKPKPAVRWLASNDTEICAMDGESDIMNWMNGTRLSHRWKSQSTFHNTQNSSSASVIITITITITITNRLINYSTFKNDALRYHR